MTLGKARGFLYRLARVLGDVQAIWRAKVPRRILRRPAGKVTGRFLRRIFRVAILLAAAQASAGEEPGLTVILPEGGSVRQEGGRVDLYDAKSNRIGYGHTRPDGSVDVFNTNGTRRATIERAPGGGTRVTVPGSGRR